MVKPIVVFIGDESDLGGNSERGILESLKFVIENDYNCVFERYSVNSFKNNFTEIKEKFLSGLVILFIMTQDAYDEQDKTLIGNINLVRENISENVLIIIGTVWREAPNDNIPTKDVIKTSLYNHLFIENLKKLTEDFQLNHGFFGAETTEQQELLTNQLLSNSQNQIDSDENFDFGRGDYNQQILSESMRLRLLSGAGIIKNEFDKKLTKEFSGVKFTVFSEEDYAKAIRKMERRSERQKEHFNSCVQRSYSPGSHGSHNGGFVLDEATLNFEISFGFANHEEAKYKLRNKLSQIESIKQGTYVDDTELHYRKSVTGLIMPDIDEYKIPFLRIYGTKKLPKNVYDFLVSLRTFILIDGDGNLITE